MSPRRATRKPPRPQLKVQVVALMRRGEVWLARLNPNQGAEVGKVRPVVVIQADALTEAGLATLLVVPLTSQRRHGAEALRVPIPARDRLLRECWAMAEQPRSLDRNRIGEGPLTRLSAEEMAALEQALQAAPAGVSKLMAKHSSADGTPAPSPGFAPLGKFPRGAPARRHRP